MESISQSYNEKKSFPRWGRFFKLFGFSIAWVAVSMLIALLEFSISDGASSFLLKTFVETKFYIWLSMAFFLDLGVYLHCHNSEKISSTFIMASIFVLGGATILLLVNSIKDLRLYFDINIADLNLLLFITWVACFILFKMILLHKQKCLHLKEIKI